MSLVVLTLAIAACSDSEGASTDSGTMLQTGTPSGGSGGAGAADPTACPSAGTCIDTDCGATSDGCTWSCNDLDEPCAEAVFSGFGMTLARPYSLADMSGSDCILQALREGTPGIYRWRVVDEMGTSFFARTLHIVEGRIANGQSEEIDPSGTRYSRRGPGVLQDAAVFTGCQAEGNGDDIWECLEGWAKSCSPTMGSGGSGGNGGSP